MRGSVRGLTLPALLLLGLAVQEAQGQIMTVPLPPLPENQEVLVLEVAMEPGRASAPHRHNAHVFVYVLEGTVQMQVEGGELMTLTPGQMFYENPNDIHSVSRNASDTEPARILVHIIKTAGAPVTTPVSGDEAADSCLEGAPQPTRP